MRRYACGARQNLGWAFSYNLTLVPLAGDPGVESVTVDVDSRTVRIT